MSNGKSDLFVFLGAAFAVLFGLFALQKWYGSYIDIRFNAELQQGGPSDALASARRADEEQAAKRKLPIDQAMTRLAQRGRDSFSAITPSPSQDLSAVAGWIHRPGFKPVTAHPVRTPPKAAAQPSAEEVQPQGAAPAAVAQPAH